VPLHHVQYLLSVQVIRRAHILDRLVRIHAHPAPHFRRRDIQRNLPRHYYRHLPSVATAEHAGEARAYVMAVDTPYYAVSDERGAFTITGVPAGTYKYHAWRAGAPELTGSITTTDGHSLDIRW